MEKITPHCDFENIESYYSHPMDVPEPEMRVLSVYFPVGTTNDQIKEAMKPLRSDSINTLIANITEMIQSLQQYPYSEVSTKSVIDNMKNLLLRSDAVEGKKDHV